MSNAMDGNKGNQRTRFLALGDSYTIGANVNENHRWPMQLVAALRESGVQIADPIIIAQTGWSTAELMDGIDKANPKGKFDLVSIQIGVNNQYRGYSVAEYRAEFQALLQRAIAFTGGIPKRVIVLSIPDWSVTPFAKDRDRPKIAAEIDSFNQTNQQEANQSGVRYVDISMETRDLIADPSLLTFDGLHPSRKVYKAWTQAILPEAQAALEMGITENVNTSQP